MSKKKEKMKMNKKDVNALIHFEKHKGEETASTTMKGDQESLKQLLFNIIDLFVKNEIIKPYEICAMVKYIEEERNDDKSRFHF